MANSPEAVALFDIDGTLYPANHELTTAVDDRITDYVSRITGLERAEADQLRRRTLRAHGTTLRGLMDLYGVDPIEFFDFVAAVDPRDYLEVDLELAQLLDRLTARPIAFTNGPRFHAERVLEALGIPGVFERVYTIEDSNYVGKPELTTYAFILEDLRVAAEQITMVEDTLRFLAPAKSLGWRTVLIAGPEAEAPGDVVDVRCDTIYRLPEAAPWLFA